MRSQIKRFVHRYAIGAPVGAALLYAGIFGAAVSAAGFDARAKAFVSDQITMWLAFRDSSAVIGWAIFAFLIWLALVLWSWEWHTEYATIESKLPPVSGTISAVEDGDTMVATGTTGLHGLYIGNIIASAGSLRDDHRLELAIIGFNGSGEAISISDIAGQIRAGDGNIRDMDPLDIPAMRSSVRAESGGEFVLVLHQHLTPSQAKEFLVALENERLQLDLRSLHITVACVSDISRSTRLPLWDAVALRRRDDIVSNRVTIMGIQAAADVKVSLGMVVARVDGATEHRDA